MFVEWPAWTSNTDGNRTARVLDWPNSPCNYATHTTSAVRLCNMSLGWGREEHPCV